MCRLHARRHRANWKWERSFNLTLFHAPKSSSSLCIFLNLFGSSFAYLSALFLCNSRIHKGTAQCSTEGWATINEWLFSIRCSHCGCSNWLHLWNKTIPSGAIFLQQKRKNDLHGKIHDFNPCRLNNRSNVWQIGLRNESLWPSLIDNLNSRIVSF